MSEDEVSQIIYYKGFKNIQLISGDVFDTLAKYLSDYPETRIALLHLDMDVKEPTEYALELLYEKVVPNGLIVFDDYSTVAGESHAVDVFLKKYKLRIFKSKHYKVPSYVRKPL